MSSVLVGIDYYLIRRSRWCCCRLYTHLLARLLRSPLHIPRGHLSNLSQLDTQQRHLYIHTTRRNLTGIAQVPCRIGSSHKFSHPESTNLLTSPPIDNQPSSTSTRSHSPPCCPSCRRACLIRASRWRKSSTLRWSSLRPS